MSTVLDLPTRNISIMFRDMHVRPAFIALYSVDLVVFCLVAMLVASVSPGEGHQNHAFLRAYLLCNSYEFLSALLTYHVGFRCGIQYMNIVFSVIYACLLVWGIGVCMVTWSSCDALLYFPCTLTVVYCIVKHFVILPQLVDVQQVGALLDRMAAEAREPFLNAVAQAAGHEGRNDKATCVPCPTCDDRLGKVQSVETDVWQAGHPPSALEAHRRTVQEEACYTVGGDALVIKASPGKGLGVFAVGAIPPDHFLECYGGELRCDGDVLTSTSAYLFSLGGERCIDASDGCEGTTWTRYMNHARAPRANCVARVCFGPATSHCVVAEDGSWMDANVPAGPRVEIWTSRSIRPSEELAFDYGREYADRMRQECQAQGITFVE